MKNQLWFGIMGIIASLCPVLTQAQNVFPETGNVGIGVSAPAAMLDIAPTGWDARSVILGRLPEGTGVGWGTYLGVQTGLGTANNRSFRFEHGFYGNTNAAIGFYHGSTETEGSLIFMVNSGTEAMRLDNLGNVGIGIEAPGSKLSVNGTITAKRLTVRTAGWPDYVFEQGYQLMPLNQVGKYIKQYSHLPEVPAAAEVQQQSTDVEAMQKLLVKKVEEITLYLIELNQENKALQQENELLLQELGQLQALYTQKTSSRIGSR